MFLKINDHIEEYFNETILFIELIHKDPLQEDIPVKVYFRDGEMKEGWMTKYSLNIHSNLVINKKQLEILESIFEKKVDKSRYRTRLGKLVAFLKTKYH